MAHSDRPWLTLAATVLGGAMVGLDGTAITIAAPYISDSVGASLGELELIANAYLIALAIGLLPAGRLADRFGRRKTFIIGVVGFAAASVGIAISDTVWALVMFRVLQGLAGALLQPAALALLRNAFPAEKIGLPLGIWGGANALAIGLGPVIAGVLVQGFSWPAVFLLNVPIAAIVLGLTLYAVTESAGGRYRRRGVLRALLRLRTVHLGSVLVGVTSFAVFGLLFLLTLFLQNVKGLPPIQAGAWMLPPTCVVVLSAPLGGILAQRFGPRLPVAAGFVLIAAGLAGLASLDAASEFSDLLYPGALVGFGIGMSVIAATEAMLGATPEEETGTVSAMQQIASQAGGVLGIVTVGTVMSWQVLRSLPNRIGEAGLPGPIAQAVLADADAVAQGTVPAAFDGPQSAVTAAVRTISELSFTDGMGAALLVVAGVALLGAVFALALPGKARQEAVAASVSPPADSATR